MDLLRHKKMVAGRGFLDDQFLIAMPGMKDDRFTRSVIYICAHSDEGAMGLIINQTQQMLFPDLLVQARHHERTGGDPLARAGP